MNLKKNLSAVFNVLSGRHGVVAAALGVTSVLAAPALAVASVVASPLVIATVAVAGVNVAGFSYAAARSHATKEFIKKEGVKSRYVPVADRGFMTKRYKAIVDPTLIKLS